MTTTTRPYVFLREDRNYVQGTQMIARAAELLEGWTFCNARFDRITNSRIELSLEKPEQEPIGLCSYASGGEKQFVYFTSINEMANKSDEKMGFQLTESAKSGHFTFSGVFTFEDLLNVIVQSVKSSHRIIGNNLSDLWLSGMRNFAIPDDCPVDSSSGSVETKLLKVIRTRSAHQSLWQVRLNFTNNLSFEGAVTFAFKPLNAATA